LKVTITGVVGPTKGSAPTAYVSKEYDHRLPLPRPGDWIAWSVRDNVFKIYVQTVTLYPDEDRVEIRMRPHKVVPDGLVMARVRFQMAGFDVRLPNESVE